MNQVSRTLKRKEGTKPVVRMNEGPGQAPPAFMGPRRMRCTTQLYCQLSGGSKEFWTSLLIGLPLIPAPDDSVVLSAEESTHRDKAKMQDLPHRAPACRAFQSRFFGQGTMLMRRTLLHAIFVQFGCQVRPLNDRSVDGGLTEVKVFGGIWLANN